MVLRKDLGLVCKFGCNYCTCIATEEEIEKSLNIKKDINAK
jgi:hypothetical protein